MRHMVELASPGTGAETGFSLLIYDRHGQDIIAPLLSVRQLREMGVTLHLLLHSERGEVPDVAAVYFCQATDENLQRITQDLSAGLYSSYYLHFSTPLPRHRMEDLAQAALTAGVTADIKKVYDQFVNFISLEEDLFTLRHQGSEALSFYSLHRSDVQDSDIDPIIDAIVDGLFSVFVNLGQVPIIRSQVNNAAQLVAERLDRRLRDTLRDTRSSFFRAPQAYRDAMSFQRPVLVLVDRSADMATPLHHPWTYQALCGDLLPLSLNRLTLQGSKPARQEYDLGPDDTFWSSHKDSAFPVVAAAVEQELEDYKAAEERLKGLSAVPDAAEEGGDVLLQDNTARLTSAITSLPDLLRRKANIDRHMSIATALLEHIKKRKLDVFFETEEKILGRAALEKPLIELLRDPDCGTAEDKLRLYLIHALCEGEGGPELKAALEEAGADTGCLAYLDQWISVSKLSPSPPPGYGGGGGVAKTVSMFSKLLNQGSALVVEGVKNFVLKENKLPLTRIVDALMEGRAGEEERRYRYFDPKLLRPQDSASAQARPRQPAQDCVVFVVGGGCYAEYSNLRAYGASRASKGGPSRRLIYGCTDLMGPTAFLHQLNKLGAQISS